ncbi:MAG: tRNA uridine-5-carboxymethylaminomethyl(34) synthesis GTPase MnmE [Pseudomonadota bacterium]
MSTIFALSTGPVPAGVAVIRISGPQAFAAVDDLILGALPPPRFAALRRLINPETHGEIDTGLVLVFPQPASFSGEDCAELQVHGSRAVVAALSETLVGLGLRPAEAGEFTRRALLNDKLSLTEVEGLGDVLQAETQQQLKLAQLQTSGALKAQYDDWRAQLIALRARLEAELDFSDEELPSHLLEEVRRHGQALLQKVAEHQLANAAAERVRGGIKAVIVGPPNAGKSTLLNRLAQRDVAIVSDEPGTTRDSLEVQLDLAGYPITLVDTAGLRSTSSEVEREGIARAERHIASADIVITMTAPELAMAPLERAADIQIFNKIDLGGPEPAGWLRLSLRSGAGVDQFLQILTELTQQRFSWGTHVVTGQARHHAALQSAESALTQALLYLEPGTEDLVLAAEHLRQAAHHLACIVGRTDVEDVLGEIFSSFCIGK